MVTIRGETDNSKFRPALDRMKWPRRHPAWFARLVTIQAVMESSSMPPIQVNRRRFLSCSAVASFALTQGNLSEAAGVEGGVAPVRLGVVGVGNRGTALVRSLLDLRGASIVAVCDAEPKHRLRGQGIVERGVHATTEKEAMGAGAVGVPADDLARVVDATCKRQPLDGQRIVDCGVSATTVKE